jgi:hypothetical protein
VLRAVAEVGLAHYAQEHPHPAALGADDLGEEGGEVDGLFDNPGEH